MYIDRSEYNGFGERKRKPTGESVVYIDEANNRVVKVKDPYAKTNLKGHAASDALYEHIVHNLLFPNARYTLLGISEDAIGDVRFVLEQNYLAKGFKPATQEQIDHYLTDVLGLIKVEKPYLHYENDYYSISDVEATGDNVIVGNNGELHFIDPIIKFKKPAKEVVDYITKSKSSEQPRRTDTAVAEAEQQTDTTPTEAQKEAGNYKKGHVKIDGYDISIEQPKGSVRSGTDENGNLWSVTMNNTYGYIRGTEGVDGDHIDVFLSDDPTQGNVYVIDQVNPKTGEFDEHKVMYGFPDMESARKAYLSNYEEGWRGLGAITPVSKEEFKKWIESSHRKTKPFAEYVSVKPLDKEDTLPTPKGRGVFGNIYDQFRGKVKEAFDFLIKHKEGDLLGVFHDNELGDIDLVWGSKDENKGLEHIIDKHVGEGKDFATVDEAMRVIEDVINNGSKIKDKWDKVTFDLDGRRVVVRKNVRDDKGNLTDEKKNWVVTSFDNNVPKSKKKSETSTIATPESITKAGLSPSTDIFDGKDTKNSATEQKKVTNNSNTEGNAQIPEHIISLVEDYKAKTDAVNKIWTAWLADKKGGTPDYGDTREEMQKAEDAVVDAAAKLSDEQIDALEARYGYGIAGNINNLIDLVKERKAFLQHYNEGLQQQGEITGNAKTKSLTAVAESFTSKEDQRPQMNGIYHDPDGYGVATDAHLLLASKALYDSKNKGKVIAAHKVKDGKKVLAEKGEVIEGRFPAWRNAIPKAEDANTVKVDWKKLSDFLAGAMEQKKQAKAEEAIVYVRMPDGEVHIYNIENLAKFVNAAIATGKGVAEYTTYDQPLIARNNDGVQMIMPMYIKQGYEGREFFYDLKNTTKRGNVALFQKVGEKAQPVSEAEAALRDGVISLMQEAGMEVSTKWKEAQKILDNANGGVQMMTAAESKRRWEREESNRKIDEATALVTGKNIKNVRRERIEREAQRREQAKEIYEIILSGEYNSVSLQKIDDFLNDVTPNNPYGRRLSERLPQAVERRMYERTRENAIDALYSRASESAIPANERTGAAGKRAVEAKKKELLEQWAKATGNWHTDLKDFTENTEAVSDDTTDSDVYLSNDGAHVIKLSRGKQGKRFGSDMDAVPLFNYVFPNSAYKILGYGDFGKGFVRVLEQPYVDFATSTPLTETERVEYMAKLGFKPINKENTAFSNGEIVVADLQGNNIVRDAAGNISVIDADCKLHTKDVGGKYEYLPVEHDLPENNIKLHKVYHGSGADFYSNAERAVEGIQQEKATPEQWLKMIEKNGGLKAGEDKWLGLSEWLKGSDEKTLTKQQILDYIRENKIQVEEVEYSDARMPNDFAYNLRTELYDKADDVCGDVTDDYADRIEEAEDFSDELDEKEDEMINEARRRLDEEFGVSTEPYISIQFETDRRRLVYEPTGSERDFSNNFAQKVWNQRNENEDEPINETRLDYTTEGLDNKREIVLTVPTVEPWNEHDEVHFGEAGGGRAVAWVRFGETTDKDGNRVLVIDEIQSKRHQEGREKGYITQKDSKRVKELEEKRDKLKKELKEVIHDLPINEDLTIRRDAIENELKDIRHEIHLIKEQGYIPDAPFEKNWHELAMKRMLRYAAENGYDKIAWTTGEQQAERYDLSKQVKKIEASGWGEAPSGETTKLITIYTNSGRYYYPVNKEGVIVGDNEFVGKKLEEVLGKDLASRLMADNEQTIEDDGLRIGGEGMKGFYDQMLPRFMDKYGKKWNVKTTDVELPDIGDNGLTMHSVDVTPEMKRSVMEGQPMFFRTADGEAYGFTLNGKIYIDPRIATAETPVHEYAHLWAQALRAANPEAWERLKGEMFKQKDVADFVRRKYPELKTDDEIAEEIFTHYSGKRGAERLRAEMQAEMDKANGVFEKAQVASVFAKLRDLLHKFWSMARDMFAGRMKSEDIAKLKADDFADMMMADLMHKVNPREQAKARDKEYMDAVEKGDMETARRKVKEAAKAAMQETKVVDENGEPLVVYHGTTNDEVKRKWNEQTKTYDTEHKPFTVFKTIYLDGLPSVGHFFVNSEDNAAGYGYTVYPVYLNMQNPLVIDCKGSAYNSIEHGGERHDTYEWAAIAQEKGYDGVIFKNIRDGVDYGAMQEPVDEYVAFDSNQIKSADPVTYDDNGNVIPLRERFNSGSEDIRYQRDISASSFKNDNRNLEHDTEFVKRVEELTGVKFKKSSTSNSWYGYKNGKEIRISDHFNKKTDQDKYYFNEAPDYIAAKINGENPFSKFKKGDKITHSADKIGEVEFQSYDANKGFVEVKLPDGSIHKYDEEKFSDSVNFPENEPLQAGEDIGEKEVENIFVDTSKTSLPSNRNEAIDAVAKLKKPFINKDQNKEIKVSNTSIRHSATQDNSFYDVRCMGIIDKIINNAVKLGEIPVAKNEEGHTHKVEVYYCPVNIDGTQLSARLIVKQYENRGSILEDLQLYDLHSTQEKTDASYAVRGKKALTPASASANIFTTTSSKSDDSSDNANHYSRYKIKKLIHTTQVEDKKILGIPENEELLFRTLDPESDEVKQTATPEEKRQAVERLSEKLHTPITVVEDVSEITHRNPEVQEKRRRAKGWYDTATGEVVVVLPNNGSVEDAVATVFHETVSHKGLRELVGEENYDNFLDEIHGHLKDDLKQRVNNAAYKEWADSGFTKDYQQCRRTATDELMAEIAEKQPEDMTEKELSLWDKICHFVRQAIDKFLAKANLKLPKWVTLGENEIKYMLWKSRENLEGRTKADYVDMARDIAKREELNLDNYDDTAEYSDGDSTPEQILNDGSMNTYEKLAMIRTQMAQANKDSRQMRDQALKALDASLTSIRKAVSLQKEFDRTTVKRVSDLATVMIKGGYLSDMSQNEVKRLLSVVKNSVGKTNIESDINRLLDIMTGNQLRNAERMLHSLETIRGSKVDAKGVEVQGVLDVTGQEIMKAFKKGRHYTETELKEAIARAEERMASDNDAISEAAANEYAGLQFAQEYQQKITESKAEERALRDEIKRAKEEATDAERDTDAFKEYIGSMYEAIRQNKVERIEAYHELLRKLGGGVRESIERAQEFKEREKERIKEIHHNANSDMQGRELKGHRKDTFADNVSNNIIVRIALSPLVNLDQMLRLFGSKNPDGKGYLWNEIMYDWMAAVDNEESWRERYMDKLSKGAARIFGKNYKYNDIESYADAQPAMPIKYWDGADFREYELSQTRMMYLYAVDKMTMGRATNRKMGISDEAMDRIKENLDPKIKEFVDWVQDTFLPDMRNEINEVHKRMFGANIDSFDNYFHFVRDRRAIKQPTENNGGENHAEDKITTVTGSLKKRTASTAYWDIPNCNFLDVLTNNVTEMGHWVSFAELNRDLGTLLSYKRFEQQVRGMHSVYGAGGELWDNFQKVCAIATDAYEPKTSKADKYVMGIAKGITMAKVNARPFTAVKQILSAPAFWGEANPVYMLEDLISLGLIPAFKRTDGVSGGENPIMWAWRNMPNFRKRVRSRTTGDFYLQDADYAKGGKWFKGISKLQDKLKWGMIANIGVDAWTIAIGSHAIYRTKMDKYLKWGMPKELAHKKAILDAELCFNKSQQSSEGAMMAPMQIDHTVAGSAAMVFRNSSTSYTREYVAASRNLRRMVDGTVNRDFMAKQILRTLEIGTINDKFNLELQQLIDGTLPQGYIFNIGKPGGILQSAGFPDMPIQLSATRLAEKARQENHPFPLEAVNGLVDAINNPLAVFRYGNGAMNVIVNLQYGGKQFLVGVHFNQMRNGTEVSDVRGLFPKDNAEWLNWITQDKATYLNQNKIEALINQQRINLAEVEYLNLNSVAKILNNFQNPDKLFSNIVTKKEANRSRPLIKAMKKSVFIFRF